MAWQVKVKVMSGRVYLIQCDMEAEGLVRSKALMDDYCRDNNFVGWFETSAKENVNIDDAARCLVSRVSW